MGEGRHGRARRVLWGGSHDGSKHGWGAWLARVCGVAVCALAHRRELAATLFGALRGAAQEDARGDAGEDPADRADDAGDASGEADHREDGADARQCSHRGVG
eukprot:scaffold47106_cov64-Phaeocystis_antarctica.AAC.2